MVMPSITRGSAKPRSKELPGERAPELPEHLIGRRSLYGWKFNFKTFCMTHELNSLYDVDTFLRMAAEDANIYHHFHILFYPAEVPENEGKKKAAKVEREEKETSDRNAQQEEEDEEDEEEEEEANDKDELIVWFTRNFLHLQRPNVNPLASLKVPASTSVEQFKDIANVPSPYWFALPSN